MERFNKEVRDTEKVTRELKKKDMPILVGYQIFYNYVRPHMGLVGICPLKNVVLKSKVGMNGNVDSKFS